MKRDHVEVVILGGNGSGRTALMRALDHQPFLENSPHTTDPGYLQAGPTAHDPDPDVSMTVVDVPNPRSPYQVDKRHQYVTQHKGAVLICFDTSDYSSFMDARNIHQLVEQKIPAGSVQVFLVGTKTDLPRTEYSVSQRDVLRYAASTDIRYVSCSAKTGQGVEQVFEAAKSKVLESRAPKIRPAVPPPIVEKRKEEAPLKKVLRFVKKSASESSQQESKPKEDNNPNTLEVVLSGIKLSKEQRAELNAMAIHSDAYVIAHRELFNNTEYAEHQSEDKLKSGGKLIARTDRGRSGDKIAITIEYSDQNAVKTMEEVANRIFNVAVTQEDTLEIRTSHDEAKLLAKALENKNLQPKEEVYRVNIQGMKQDLNRYGPPAFLDTEKIHKEIVQDPVTKELQSLQQSVVTPDGKGVITASANYLPPDQDSKQGAQLANQIQVELRPSAGQFLDANTVKAFRDEVENMRQGGTVQVDASNSREFNALLMTPQPQAQQVAPAAAAVPNQPENPLPMQEEKSSKRTSRMTPPIALSRQQSVGEIESYSPREDQSGTAKANPKLEKTPTSENILKQADQIAEQIFESPRAGEARPAEKSPLIQRLHSESAKSKSASEAPRQDTGPTAPKLGKQ